MTISLNDLIMGLSSLANERGLSKDLILGALDTALSTIAEKKLGEGCLVKLVDAQIYREFEVVEDDKLTHPVAQIKISDLPEEQKDQLKAGDIIQFEVSPDEFFGRIEAFQAKQIVSKIIKEAERQKIAEYFEGKIGTMLTGQVKRVYRESVVLDILDAQDVLEAEIARKDMIYKESVRVGDRLRVYLQAVRPDAKGSILKLSRTCNGLIEQLFISEVPEIAEGIVEIKAISREPGFRTKIAVKTKDKRVDPIGACVGMRGVRVTAISEEIGGERIDIVIWDENPVQLVINALGEKSVNNIEINEDEQKMYVVVKDDALRQAIGKSGQNVRLTSALCGWHIDIAAEKDDQVIREAQNEKVSLLQEKLTIDAEIAEILIRESLDDVNKIAACSVEDISTIEEFDSEIAEQIHHQAQTYLFDHLFDEEEVESPLSAVTGLGAEHIEALGAQGVTTVAELAQGDAKDLAAKLGCEAEEVQAWINEAAKLSAE